MNFKPILFHVESIGDLTPNLFSFFLNSNVTQTNWLPCRFDGVVDAFIFSFLSIDSFLCTRLTNGIKSRELATLAPSFARCRPTSGAVRDLGRWGYYYTTRLSYMVTLFAPLPFHGLVSAHQRIQHIHTYVYAHKSYLPFSVCASLAVLSL